MEKSYSLRNVRKDGGIVSAAIYLGHRRIGNVHEDTDSGAAGFEFDLSTDRIVFEQYVQSWWAGADALATAGFACNDSSFVPSLQDRMRYWMKAMVNDLAIAKQSRRAA